MIIDFFFLIGGGVKIWVQKSTDIIESTGNFLGRGVKNDILKNYAIDFLTLIKFCEGLCQSSLHGSFFLENIIEKGT